MSEKMPTPINNQIVEEEKPVPTPEEAAELRAFLEEQGASASAKSSETERNIADDPALKEYYQRHRDPETGSPEQGKAALAPEKPGSTKESAIDLTPEMEIKNDNMPAEKLPEELELELRETRQKPKEEKLPEELELELRESKQEKTEKPVEKVEAITKEMLEASAEKLAATRQEMVAAMRTLEKASASVKKLSGWRKFFSQTADKKEKEDGAARDKKSWEEELTKKTKGFTDALAVHRKNLIEDKKQQLKITPEKTETIKKLNIPDASSDLIKAGDLELITEYEKQSEVKIDRGVPYNRRTTEQKAASDFIDKNKSNYERAKKNKEVAILRLAALPQVDRAKAGEVYTEIAAQKSLDGYAKEVINLTTSQEAIEIYNLKYQQEIEEKKKLGEGQKWEKIKEKGLEAAQWYRKQPTKNKLLVSAGLMAGGALVGAAGGLVGAAAFAGIFVGKLSQRVLGAAGTGIGLEALIKNAQEAEARKGIEKKLDGKFLEALQQNLDENNKQLDDELFRVLGGKKTEERRRNLLAGGMAVIIGSGALSQAVGNLIPSSAKEWAAEKLGLKVPGADQTVKDGAASKPLGIADRQPGVPGALPETVPNGTKAVEEIQNLKIGARGPEGAIIDNFKDKPELAKAFGWDGKTDIKEWAGTRAHQLWLKSVDEELAKPGMTEKLTAQGFTADAEGYAKAMHKIGKGFVQIAPTGEVQLTDDTSFLKTVQPKFVAEELSSGAPTAPEVPATGDSTMPKDPVPEVPAEPKITETPTAEKISLTPEKIVDNNIKEAVRRLVEPEILTDKTFKAAAKIPLGKILNEIPPEAYEDKYALSRYWHSLSGPGVHTPDLPGTGFLQDLSYDDFRKYSKMAKFLRENAGAGAAEKLKDMTVEDFLKTYGNDLGKTITK